MSIFFFFVPLEFLFEYFLQVGYMIYMLVVDIPGKVNRGEMNWWGWDGLVGTPLASDLTDWLATNSLPDSIVFHFMKESDCHYARAHTHTQIILLIN